MPFHVGVPELVILLIILLLLFGVGRISKIAGEMGKGIRTFKEGLQGAADENAARPDQGDAAELK